MRLLEKNIIGRDSNHVKLQGGLKSLAISPTKLHPVLTLRLVFFNFLKLHGHSVGWAPCSLLGVPGSLLELLYLPTHVVREQKIRSKCWCALTKSSQKPTCFSSCSFSNFCIKSCAPSNEANQKCHKWLWWLVNIAGKSSAQHSMEQTLPCYRYVLELVSSLAEIMSFDSSQSKSLKKTGKCDMSNFKPTWKIAWFSLQKVVVWCGAVSAWTWVVRWFLTLAFNTPMPPKTRKKIRFY